MMDNQTRFGRWEVIERHGSPYWTCKCDCGTVKQVYKHSLIRGRSKSCGCLRDEKRHTFRLTHGQAKKGNQSPAYKSWGEMIARCFCDTSNIYEYYGGRGITVCDHWRKFENFFADMGERPPNTSLDRIDVNGNYEPGNCRWATRKQQARNTRSTHYIIVEGKRISVPDAAETYGIDYGKLKLRLRRGWTVERALEITA